MTRALLLTAIDRSRPERFLLTSALVLIGIWLFDRGPDEPRRRRASLYDPPPEETEKH
ncbi:MAG TPA: hypothetical protein VNY84_02550 [Acidimicrobiales bacterium]|nr:hypothetical protein [Acidimicrobiales bacterium]